MVSVFSLNAYAVGGDDRVTAETDKNVKLCVNDTKQSMRGIRACSRLLKDAGAASDLRSDIHVRRGLLYLNSEHLMKAGQDFEAASHYNAANEFAYLGQGFVAIFEKDYKKAASLFNDCRTHAETAPLAIYGRAMAKELMGDISGAKHDYQKAAELKPDWVAPLEELDRLNQL